MENKIISVLEDSLDIQEVVRIILESEEFQVMLFPTVAEFELGIADFTPDVFLLDVMLPDGNGLEVCERLKCSEKTQDIPVVVMTASTGIEKMRRDSRADAFIQKPFDIDHFVTTIRELSRR